MARAIASSPHNTRRFPFLDDSWGAKSPAPIMGIAILGGSLFILKVQARSRCNGYTSAVNGLLECLQTLPGIVSGCRSQTCDRCYGVEMLDIEPL